MPSQVFYVSCYLKKLFLTCIFSSKIPNITFSKRSKVTMKRILCLMVLFSFSYLSALDSPVPLLHLPDYTSESQKKQFLETFEKAIKEVGFFKVSGIGVTPVSINTVYDQAKEFFSSQKDLKMSCLSPNGQRGYIPGETAKDETHMDFKEFYHIGRSLSKTDLERLQYEKNIWPESPKQFRPAMEALYAQIDQCKNILGEAFSEVLGQEKCFIRSMIQEGNSVMRVIHYPADPPKDAIWARKHTDINLFTIYPPSTAQGLQIKDKEGKWIDVVIPEGILFVHCGDMLENLSNGLCKSSIHRVKDPCLHQERFAITFFVHPRTDDRLDPLPSCIEKTGGIRLYANLSHIELLAERLIDLGLANNELMKTFVRSGAIQKLKEVRRFSPKAETALIEKGFISPIESP